MENKEKFELLAEYIRESACLRRAYMVEEQEGPASFFKTHIKILEGNGLHAFYDAHHGTIEALRISKAIVRAESAQELYNSKQIGWLAYRDMVQQWCSHVLDIMELKNALATV